MRFLILEVDTLLLRKHESLPLLTPFDFVQYSSAEAHPALFMVSTLKSHDSIDYLRRPDGVEGDVGKGVRLGNGDA